MNAEIDAEQLIELQRQALLGRLLAGVAHEMSAPLGSILSNLDVAARLYDRLEAAIAAGPDRARDLLASGRDLARVDREAAERLRRLVRSLKIASRVPDPEPKSANLNDIVDAAVQLARANFRNRIEMKTEFGELAEVQCYPHLLSQAILNLLTNAGQAIEGAGVITAGTFMEGDSVHIWISDTGHGIREEDKPKVFNRGFTTKGIGLGTGLGLMIVRQIVTEEHGGTIDFESEQGRGTTFHLRIPLTPKKKGA